MLENVTKFTERMVVMEPVLNLKNEKQDILKSLTTHVLNTWEERHGFLFLKKQDAEQEFNFFKNEIAALERQTKKQEKSIEQLKEH